MRYQLVGAGKGSIARPVDTEKFRNEYDRIYGKKRLPNELGDLPKGKGLKDRSSVLDDSNSSISVMMRDEAMVRMIREGKAEDRGLKREAERIERENSTRPKEMFRKRQQEKLEQARLELRRSQR